MFNGLVFGTLNNDRKVVSLWIILFLVVFVGACSPKVGSGLLKFIFDGVPDKEQKDSGFVSKAQISDSSKISSQTTGQGDVAGLFYHAPYKDRACTKCHNDEVPGKVIFAQDVFCYTCHEDFQKKYSIVHGPVAGGFCTTCHSPHFGDNKNLLIRKGQELCLNCHTMNEIQKYETHSDIGKTNCTECHNPHGGNDRFLSN